MMKMNNEKNIGLHLLIFTEKTVLLLLATMFSFYFLNCYRKKEGSSVNGCLYFATYFILSGQSWEQSTKENDIMTRKTFLGILGGTGHIYP